MPSRVLQDAALVQAMAARGGGLRALSHTTSNTLFPHTGCVSLSISTLRGRSQIVYVTTMAGLTQQSTPQGVLIPPPPSLFPGGSA